MKGSRQYSVLKRQLFLFLERTNLEHDCGLKKKASSYYHIFAVFSVQAVSFSSLKVLVNFRRNCCKIGTCKHGQLHCWGLQIFSTLPNSDFVTKRVFYTLIYLSLVIHRFSYFLSQILTIPVSYYSFGHFILYLRLHNPNQGHLNKALTLNSATSVVSRLRNLQYVTFPKNSGHIAVHSELAFALISVSTVLVHHRRHHDQTPTVRILKFYSSLIWDHRRLSW